MYRDHRVLCWQTQQQLQEIDLDMHVTSFVPNVAAVWISSFRGKEEKTARVNDVQKMKGWVQMQN